MQGWAAGAGEAVQLFLFKDGSALLENIPEQLDLILLDIQMEPLDGMTTAERIREKDGEVLIVFITSLAQYAVQGYRVEAMDFLVKPVELHEIEACLNRAMRRIKHTADAEIVVHTSNAMHRVFIKDIICLEAVNHQTMIHTTTGDLLCPATLSSFEPRLPSAAFFRCHSAFIINLARVDSVNGTDLMTGGSVIPISKHRRKAFMTALTVYWGERL